MADRKQIMDAIQAEKQRRQQEKMGKVGSVLSGIVGGFSRGLAGHPVAAGKAGDSGMNTIRDILIANALDPTKRKAQGELDTLADLEGGVGDGEFRRKSVNVGGQTFERVPTEVERLEEVQQEADRQATIASAKEKQVNLGKVRRLTAISDVIENRFAETKPKSGMLGPISGAIDIAFKGLQFTENQRTDKAYVDFVNGFKAQLARAMGDVGNLSVVEQETALNLVPTLLDSKETAVKKLSNLREFIKTLEGREPQSQIPTNVGGDDYEEYLKLIGDEDDID